MSSEFEMAAMAAIVANCIIMAMTHADMDATWRDVMTWANLSFTAFFTVEIMLRFVALGFKTVLRVRGCVCTLPALWPGAGLSSFLELQQTMDWILPNNISSVISCLHCVRCNQIWCFPTDATLTSGWVAECVQTGHFDCHPNPHPGLRPCC